MDVDGDGGLNYKDKLAVLKGKQVNESNSELVHQGKRRGEQCECQLTSLGSILNLW